MAFMIYPAGQRLLQEAYEAALAAECRPTRREHLDQCTTFSIALTQFIRDIHEQLKFRADLWEPEPYDEAAYMAWVAEEEACR